MYIEFLQANLLSKWWLPQILSHHKIHNMFYMQKYPSKYMVKNI